MRDGAPRPRRARPVADAPIDALLLQADDLAKGWLLAVLERAPLDAAPGILAADLARDGPRICDAVVRALADEGDLRRLEPGGALERLVADIGRVAGAEGADATSAAVDALRAVIWTALRAELPGPDPEQIADLAERLALVTELVRGAALRGVDAVATGVERAGGDSPGGGGVAPGGGGVAPGGGGVAPGGGGVAPGGGGVGRASGAEPVGGGATHLRPAAQPPLEPPPGPLWFGAIEDAVERAKGARLPLSLLLVELEDARRVAAVEPPDKARAMFGRFAQAVRTVLRRQDILALESDTRAWVIARETGRSGARALAARVANAVGAAEPWRGAPMTVTIGVSVLGEDGTDSDELVGAADADTFAAAASGVSMTGDAGADGNGEPTSGPQPVG